MEDVFKRRISSEGKKEAKKAKEKGRRGGEGQIETEGGQRRLKSEGPVSEGK